MPLASRPRSGGDELTSSDAGPPAWHQALAYALTGERQAHLGHQPRPDPRVVAEDLRGRLSPAQVEVAARSRHPVPSDLAVGIGAAQFEAALAALRTLLAPASAPRETRVGPDRALTTEEQRLLREVPPHHGS